MHSIPCKYLYKISVIVRILFMAFNGFLLLLLKSNSNGMCHSKWQEFVFSESNKMHESSSRLNANNVSIGLGRCLMNNVSVNEIGTLYIPEKKTPNKMQHWQCEFASVILCSSWNLLNAISRRSKTISFSASYFW